MSHLIFHLHLFIDTFSAGQLFSYFFKAAADSMKFAYKDVELRLLSDNTRLKMYF